MNTFDIPECTAAYSKQFIVQDQWECRTCGILNVNNNFICTTCKNICHRDHDVVYIKRGEGYCDCNTFCQSRFRGPCKCCPEGRIKNKEFETNPVYCVSCSICSKPLNQKLNINNTKYDCISCKKLFCKDCISICSVCNQYVCKNCVNKCQRCQKCLCDKCRFTCRYCRTAYGNKNSFCDKCITYSQYGSEGICKLCLEKPATIENLLDLENLLRKENEDLKRRIDYIERKLSEHTLRF